MQKSILIGLLALAACGSNQDEAWNPKYIPDAARADMAQELGTDRFNILVSAPTRETKSLDWYCGMVTPEGGKSRLFVYDAGMKALHLAPVANESDPIGGVSDMMTFMDYKAPCDAR